MPATILNNLITLACNLRDKGDGQKASDLFRYGLDVLDGRQISNQSVLNSLALSHNEVAFLKYVPEKKWKEAEHHYHQAMGLFNRASNPVEAVNAELNLQTMYRLSGQKVDLERVKELIKALEYAGIPKAEKGFKLLKELLQEKSET